MNAPVDHFAGQNHPDRVVGVTAGGSPVRNGLPASRVRIDAGPWRSAGAFLQARFPHVADWLDRFADGAVLDARGQALQPSSSVRPGDLIWYWRKPAAESRVPFELEILYRDRDLLVVDKPHFLPVIPSGRYLEETALVRLQRLLGLADLAPVHRLDRDTAGVLLFTTTRGARAAYQNLFRDGQVQKYYEAIAPWRADLLFPRSEQMRIEQRPGSAFMQMQSCSGLPNTRTEIELTRRVHLTPPDLGELALYRLGALTGRNHQLRVHLASWGMPIVWDEIYPTLKPERPVGTAPDYSRPLQLLARSVSFVDPVSGEHRTFVSQRRLQLASRAVDNMAG